MRISQTTLGKTSAVAADFAALAAMQPQWVIAFGSVDALKDGAPALAEAFPGAARMGCSTAGEISARGVSDGSLVVTAVAFDKAQVKQASTVLGGMDDSRDAGRRLALGLPLADLRAIVIFGQGVQINGSAVLAGLVDVVGESIPITGRRAMEAFSHSGVGRPGCQQQPPGVRGLYGQDRFFAWFVWWLVSFWSGAPGDPL
jgi:hypothetical protein